MTTRSPRSAGLRWMTLVFLVLVAAALTMVTYAMIAEWIDPRGTNRLFFAMVDEDAGREPPLSIATPPAPSMPRQDSTSSRIGMYDGYIPDGVTLSPDDVRHPALASLDPDLLAAVQHAATDARADGIVMVVNSGWRSERYQQALFDDAVATYGSEEEAVKWVQTPERSAHVTGDAVDIGDTDADYWLIEHGNRYGLCQTYANEIWHFERVVEPGEPCPPPAGDASVSGRQRPGSLARFGLRLDVHGASQQLTQVAIQPGGVREERRATRRARSAAMSPWSCHFIV